MAVIWTERSRDDLVDIFRFIARDTRKAAERWIGRETGWEEKVATLRQQVSLRQRVVRLEDPSLPVQFLAVTPIKGCAFFRRS